MWVSLISIFSIINKDVISQELFNIIIVLIKIITNNMLSINFDKSKIINIKINCEFIIF